MKESRWRYVLTHWCTSNLIVSLIDLGEYGALHCTSERKTERERCSNWYSRISQLAAEWVCVCVSFSGEHHYFISANRDRKVMRPSSDDHKRRSGYVPSLPGIVSGTHGMAPREMTNAFSTVP